MALGPVALIFPLGGIIALLAIALRGTARAEETKQEKFPFLKDDLLPYEPKLPAKTQPLPTVQRIEPPKPPHPSGLPEVKRVEPPTVSKPEPKITKSVRMPPHEVPSAAEIIAKKDEEEKRESTLTEKKQKALKEKGPTFVSKWEAHLQREAEKAAAKPVYQPKSKLREVTPATKKDVATLKPATQASLQQPSKPSVMKEEGKKKEFDVKDFVTKPSKEAKPTIKETKKEIPKVVSTTKEPPKGSAAAKSYEILRSEGIEEDMLPLVSSIVLNEKYSQNELRKLVMAYEKSKPKASARLRQLLENRDMLASAKQKGLPTKPLDVVKAANATDDPSKLLQHAATLKAQGKTATASDIKDRAKVEAAKQGIEIIDEKKAREIFEKAKASNSIAEVNQYGEILKKAGYVKNAEKVFTHAKNMVIAQDLISKANKATSSDEAKMYADQLLSLGFKKQSDQARALEKYLKAKELTAKGKAVVSKSKPEKSVSKEKPKPIVFEPDIVTLSDSEKAKTTERRKIELANIRAKGFVEREPEKKVVSTPTGKKEIPVVVSVKEAKEDKKKAEVETKKQEAEAKKIVESAKKKSKEEEEKAKAEAKRIAESRKSASELLAAVKEAKDPLAGLKIKDTAFEDKKKKDEKKAKDKTVAAKVSGELISSEPIKIDSPFDGVSDAQWAAFVKASMVGRPNTITPSYSLGMFGFNAKRLSDYGLVDNVKRVDFHGNAVWSGRWINPYSLNTFLGSPKLQYRLFENDMENKADYIKDLRFYEDDFNYPVIGKNIDGRKASLSGLLAVAFRTSEGSFSKWLTDKTQRQTFKATTAAFEKANGLF